MTTKTQTKTDVDRDEARVRTDTRTKAEGDHDRVGPGSVVLYDLTPRAGVDLATHVGQQVQLTAIMLDRGKGDADVKIKEDTQGRSRARAGQQVEERIEDHGGPWQRPAPQRDLGETARPELHVTASSLWP